MKRKHWYTVILMYPEFMTDGLAEHYEVWAYAEDPESAVEIAQRKALKAQGTEVDVCAAEDFEAVVTFKGKHTCIW